MLGGFYEKAGLFNLGALRSDLRIEGFLGIGGETKEDWLPFGETVSDGDVGYGMAMMLKFGYPVKLESGTEIYPFVGIGPGVVVVDANGEASLDTEFATGYGYEEGFSDGVYGLLMDLGISIPLKSVIITPEYKFMVAAGDSFGDWEFVDFPDGAYWSMFTLNIGFKL